MIADFLRSWAALANEPTPVELLDGAESRIEIGDSIAEIKRLKSEATKILEEKKVPIHTELGYMTGWIMRQIQQEIHNMQYHWATEEQLIAAQKELRSWITTNFEIPDYEQEVEKRVEKKKVNDSFTKPLVSDEQEHSVAQPQWQQNEAQMTQATYDLLNEGL